MTVFWDNLLHIGLSISVLCNCWSIWGLIKANNTALTLSRLIDYRITLLEVTVKDLLQLRKVEYERRVQSMAEDTKVAE